MLGGKRARARGRERERERKRERERRREKQRETFFRDHTEPSFSVLGKEFGAANQNESG